MVRISLSVVLLLTATAYAQVTASGSGAASAASVGVSTPAPNAPEPQGNASAPQAPTVPPVGAGAAAQQTPIPATPGTSPAAPTLITLDEAVTLALANSPTLAAMRTTVPQSQAQEITAGLRPNPVLSWDALFIPIFSPGNFSESFVNNVQQFDIGVGYLIERGHKRQARLQAARDATAVTKSQLYDFERTLTFNVAQQFVNALLAKSNFEFAQQDLASFQETVNISQERYKAGDISEGDRTDRSYTSSREPPAADRLSLGAVELRCCRRVGVPAAHGRPRRLAGTRPPRAPGFVSGAAKRDCRR